MWFSMLYNENTRPVNLLWIWSYLGAALLLFEFGTSKLFSEIVFYIGCAYFVLRSFNTDLSYANVLGHGSANNLSIICIFLAALLLISLRGKQKSIPYIPTLLILFLSLWTGNRSGLLAATAFFVYSFLINRKWSKTETEKWKTYAVLLLVSLFVVVFVIRYVGFFDEALTYKLERQGMESARSILWKEYLGGMFDSIGNFFLGVPGNTPAYPNLMRYEGNPHNSFFVLHAKYGLLGFIFVVVMLAKAYKRMKRNRDYFLLGVALLVFLRAFFDWSAFPGLYDVLFWYFFFYASYGSPVDLEMSKYTLESN